MPSGATTKFLRDVAQVLGDGQIVTDPAITRAHGIDWTGRFVGPPPVVLRPTSSAQVLDIVGLARTHGTALVAQGGNTGLVGGATPLDGEVVIDLRGINGVHDLDPLAGQLSAGAGTTVAEVQAHAAAAGWAYGVDWAARDTATIGGSVATNAGGLRFVRHGDTRAQLLGVEAVLGNGTLLSHLPSVEKDNTGYALAALLCGSEGTLGVITAVRVRLVPPRGPSAVAQVAFSTVAAAVEAAHSLRREMSGLEAAELMLPPGLALVERVAGLANPFANSAAWRAVLLVEASDESDPLRPLGEAISSLPGVRDSVVAADSRQMRELWRYREEHTLAIASLGHPHKFDVTLPAGELAGFIDRVPHTVAKLAPAAQTWLFGHAADGNIHVNVTGLTDFDESVAEAVFADVLRCRGSISAEHGIGRTKKRFIASARSPGDLRAMAAIRHALDPDGICNPGVLF